MNLPHYVVVSTEQQKRWAEIHLNGNREDWVVAYEEIRKLHDATPEHEATTRESLELNGWMHAFYFIKDTIPWGTVLVRREDFRPEDDRNYSDHTSVWWESETTRFLVTEHCAGHPEQMSGNAHTVWVSDADTGRNMGLCGSKTLRRFLREESRSCLS